MSQKDNKTKNIKLRKRIFASIVCLFAIMIVSVTIIKFVDFINDKAKKNYAQSKAQEIKNINIEGSKENKIAEKSNSNIEVILSSAGDCTIGTDPRFDESTSLPAMVRTQNNDYHYLFKNAIPVFEKDDITIVNLETTFTNAKSRADKTYTFKAPPEFAKSLNLGSIEGVNISNNIYMIF